MKTLQVSLGERSYSILIGLGLLEKVGQLCREVLRAQKILLVSHPLLMKHYGPRIRLSLEQEGFQVFTYLVPPGERYKSLTEVRRLWSEMASGGLQRHDATLVLGGGMLGDLVGFASACYMRGIDFVQIPTTLLSAVDASVGGKTAIDFAGVKNLIGAFHQPRLVLCDPKTFDTLPLRDLRSGLAEVIKYGIIWDRNFFEEVCSLLPSLLGKNPESLTRVIYRSCEIKAEVVSQDERETGLRAILNYGHTIGHALEALFGYTRYRHGEAISLGMIAEGFLSERMGIAREPIAGPIIQTLVQAGLPIRLRYPVDFKALLSRMERDKKAASGTLHFVLAESLGRVTVKPVEDLSLVKEALEVISPVS